MVASIAETLRQFRFAEPFRPFELVFRDGTRRRIDRPDAVGWSTDRGALSYAADDDSFIHATLSDLTNVHLVSSTNGEGAE